MQSFAEFLTGASMSLSSYEWVRNYLGLMPLRGSCSTACWMSDAAWTEWKNYSRPSYGYEVWPPVSTTRYEQPSTISGMQRLSGSDRALPATSFPVLRNVLRLRTSKSLTVDALNVALGSAPVSAMRRWNRFDFGCGGSRMSGRTSRQLSRSDSSSQLWTGENDLIQDLRDWARSLREEHDVVLH